MKLKSYWIGIEELQSYLDKYQDKIKFVICYDSTRMILVIDES